MLTLMMDEVPEMKVKRASIIGVRPAPANPIVLAKLIDRCGFRERLPAFEVDHDLNWFNASDGRATFAVNELSGGLRYRLRPLEEEPGTDVSASPSALEQIARSFLDKLGRPSEALELAAITYLNVQSGSIEEGVTRQSKLDAGLVFKRTVDELPVIGPGGMVMVKIGTDETVVGGREVWRDVVGRGAPLPLRGPDEATSLLKQHLKKRGLDGDIRVKHAGSGYAEFGIETQQRYLEPCYAYEIVTSPEFVQSKKIEVIPAARTGPMAEMFKAALNDNAAMGLDQRL